MKPLVTPTHRHATPRTRVAIFGNPFSGSGPIRKPVAKLAAALEAHGLEPDVVWDPHDRNAKLSDDAYLRKLRCVVAAGGDGSVSAVINAMAQGGRVPDVAFATYPVGNENLFARQFGFGKDPQKLADAIAAGHTTRTDLGVADGKFFTLMVSSGFDADVTHRLDRWRRAGSKTLKRVRRVTYLPKILGSIRGYRYPGVRLEADGQTVEGAHAFVFNIPQYGGSLGICRHADHCDGRLDWVVFERPGARSLLAYGWAVLRGLHLDRADVHHGTADRVRITPVNGEPVPVQADGDPAAHAPVELAVAREALLLVTADGR